MGNKKEHGLRLGLCRSPRYFEEKKMLTEEQKADAHSIER
jgi:hypothetical protein